MTKLSIEIVSDVMCPWCIIGYKGLESALSGLTPAIQADITWLPFEINPHYSRMGKNFKTHLFEKYEGITEEYIAQQREIMAARGREAGFEFGFSEDSRIFNSFDLHRLLAWAKGYGKQTDLKLAFFSAHFSHCMPLYDDATVLSVVRSVGLDSKEAANILNSRAFADEVRAEQALSAAKGIHSVPTFIINDKKMISGGQTAEVFENILREAASESPSSN
jgi:predicted DsbA family dithiol-disulfide isomerase